MHFEDFCIEQDYYDFEGYTQAPNTQPVMPPRGGLPRRPLNPVVPEEPTMPQRPPVIKDEDYIQGYLRTVIGRYVKVEFILGTNMLIDREGTLVEVGIDHIVLREPETDDLVVADLYSIKFVRIYY